MAFIGTALELGMILNTDVEGTVAQLHRKGHQELCA